MKKHRIPPTSVCKKISRQPGEELLRTIAERSGIQVGIDWNTQTKWPSPEFLARYKALDPKRQGAFNAVLVVIEDIGKGNECERYADMLLASMGKPCPPGLSLYDKAAWAYCNLEPAQWEHLRRIAKASSNLRNDWAVCVLPEDSKPELTQGNLLRLFSEERLYLVQHESRGGSGEIVSYNLAGGEHISILSLADRVVARRQMVDGKAVACVDNPVFDIVYYYDPKTRTLRVWSDSEDGLGRQRLLELWSGIYANTADVLPAPKNHYHLDVFLDSPASILEPRCGISATITEIVYGSDAGDYGKFKNYSLGVFDGAFSDVVRTVGGDLAAVSCAVTGDVNGKPIAKRTVTFHEDDMLGCDGDGEEQDAIRGYFREMGVIA